MDQTRHWYINGSRNELFFWKEKQKETEKEIKQL
jgi:hypothetical protein